MATIGPPHLCGHLAFAVPPAGYQFVPVVRRAQISAQSELLNDLRAQRYGLTDVIAEAQEDADPHHRHRIDCHLDLYA